MLLRKLKIEDAPLMLEWMHDEDVCEFMGRNFSEFQLCNCENFIENSLTDEKNLHLAIADENDEYMGTVSLKEIDMDTLSAEFAITVRKKAMGKGFSKFGMENIIKKGFEELGLETIIWNVSKKNIRANKFYQKHNYDELDIIPDKFKNIYPNWKEMNWFCVIKKK